MYNSIIHYALCPCIATPIRIWSDASISPSLNKNYYSVLNENKYNDLAVDPGYGGIRLVGLVHTSHAKIAFNNVNLHLNCHL